MTINNLPKWNRLVFGRLSAEDPKPNVVENLPPYKEVVIVTDGTRVWLDVFKGGRVVASIVFKSKSYRSCCVDATYMADRGGNQ